MTDRTESSEPLLNSSNAWGFRLDQPILMTRLTGFIALGLVGVLLYEKSSGAPLLVLLLVLLPGLLGLWFRMSFAPYLFLLLVVWLEWMPDTFLVRRLRELPPTARHFRLQPMLLTFGMLLYLGSYLRLTTLRYRWLPREDPANPSAAPEPTRNLTPNQSVQSRVTRAEETTPPHAELTRRGLGDSVESFYGLALLAVILTVVATITWFFTNSVRVETTEFPPLRWGGLDRWDSRQQFLLVAGVVVLWLGVVYLVAIWPRTKLVTPVLARQQFLDQLWAELRRELSRAARRRARWFPSQSSVAVPLLRRAQRFAREEREARKKQQSNSSSRRRLIVIVISLSLLVMICCGCGGPFLLRWVYLG